MKYAIVARRFFGVCALCMMAISMFGCNTTKGVGRDIEATGDAIEDAAEDADD
ncbi:MAG TPA: entericidin A/B family lipoprotein [Tepidisphaeraceae bacterium]|nr:entericidin A/B family lipoprotein [Tepidisphaeraceae bacterium]